MNNKKKLIILIGTMTGNAELVADDIVDYCSKENIETKIYEMNNIKPEEIKNFVDPILICTSTYGQGDVPDNAKAFYNFLNKKKPNLNNIKYTIFGLGDKTYKETFSLVEKDLIKYSLHWELKELVNHFFMMLHLVHFQKKMVLNGLKIIYKIFYRMNI